MWLSFITQVRCNKHKQTLCTKINLCSCSFVLCDAVMRVKVLIQKDHLPISRSESSRWKLNTGIAPENYGQLFAILNLIFCYKEEQNGLLIVCQSTITLFAVLRLSPKETEESPVFSCVQKKTWLPISNRSHSCIAVKYRNHSESNNQDDCVSYPHKQFISSDVSRWICLP